MKYKDISNQLRHFKHRFWNSQNLVLLIGLFIALSFIWGSLETMQANYARQREIDLKQRQLELATLQRDNLSLEQRYYQTAEYQELKAREALGLVQPGEHVLILPPSSADEDSQTRSGLSGVVEPSNFEQWVNFLFGGHHRRITTEEAS